MHTIFVQPLIFYAIETVASHSYAWNLRTKAAAYEIHENKKHTKYAGFTVLHLPRNRHAQSLFNPPPPPQKKKTGKSQRMKVVSQPLQESIWAASQEKGHQWHFFFQNRCWCHLIGAVILQIFGALKFRWRSRSRSVRCCLNFGVRGCCRDCSMCFFAFRCLFNFGKTIDHRKYRK